MSVIGMIVPPPPPPPPIIFQPQLPPQGKSKPLSSSRSRQLTHSSSTPPPSFRARRFTLLAGLRKIQPSPNSARKRIGPATFSSCTARPNTKVAQTGVLRVQPSTGRDSFRVLRECRRIRMQSWPSAFNVKDGLVGFIDSEPTAHA